MYNLYVYIYIAREPRCPRAAPPTPTGAAACRPHLQTHVRSAWGLNLLLKLVQATSTAARHYSNPDTWGTCALKRGRAAAIFFFFCSTDMRGACVWKKKMGGEEAELLSPGELWLSTKKKTEGKKTGGASCGMTRSCSQRKFSACARTSESVYYRKLSACARTSEWV